VVEKAHSAASVPEAKGLRFVDALDVVVDVDLDDDLGSVRQPRRREELRERRGERLAELELPGEVQ